MRNKFLILGALAISAVGFCQKDEIKAAEKAMKSGDAMSAKSALVSAASSINSADEKMQAEYYFISGNVYADLAKKGDASAFNDAVSSYQKVLAIEKKSGKNKYSDEAQTQLNAMTVELVNGAVKDNNEKKYKEAADKLYLSYKLSPKDTVYLYYAAGSSVSGHNYEDALKYYNDLKDIGYDGSEKKFTAVNVESGKVEEMDKTQRDLMVKSGTYKDPKEEITPSKKPEIVKNIALIYTELGQDDKAMQAYTDARANDPKDVTLILNQANLYYKLGDKDKFKELMSEATKVAPDNADLFYNIGVINMEQGNLDEARDSYKRALEINPGYVNAQLNLSTTYVNQGNALIDQMNALGNSKADIAKYDDLKAEKDSLFLEGSKVLESALKTNPDNQSVLEQLKNIYGALGDNENFMRIKKLMGE